MIGLQNVAMSVYINKLLFFYSHSSGTGTCISVHSYISIYVDSQIYTSHNRTSIFISKFLNKPKRGKERLLNKNFKTLEGKKIKGDTRKWKSLEYSGSEELIV